MKLTSFWLSYSSRSLNLATLLSSFTSVFYGRIIGRHINCRAVHGASYCW